MDKETDDGLLIQKYLAGDNEALGRIYDRYASLVYNYLRARVDSYLAEDVLHETFIRAAESFKKYTHHGKLRSWLLTIARNQLFDQVRKASKLKEQSFDILPDDMHENHRKTPLDKQLENEIGQKIKIALKELTEPQREVFLLREEAGLQFKDIAELMGIPLNTALSHMRRAITALQTKLSDYAQ